MVQLVIGGTGFNEVVKGRYGYICYNKNDMFVGRAIRVYGEYSEAEVCLFKQICQPGDYVMDIGANIGTHTLALSQIVGPEGFVFAFEPQSIVFQTLCANMAINSIENVECFRAAVSDKNGEIKLPRFDYTKDANYGGVKVEDYNIGDKVQTITVDSYFKSLNRLDFMKIDVEGMEEKVLKGAAKYIDKFQPTLYVENDKIDKSESLINYIKSISYIPYWHTPFLFNRNNYAEHHTNIYEGIVSVNMLCVPEMYKLKAYSHLEAIDSTFHPLRKKA